MSRLITAVRRSPLTSGISGLAEEIAASAAFLLLIGSALAWLAVLA